MKLSSAAAVLLITVARGGCSTRKADSSGDPPPRSEDQTPKSLEIAADAASGDTIPASIPCLPLEPARVAVRGVLRREVHLGPPGYGETPSRDERDTIVVLMMPRRTLVCGVTAGSAQDSSIRVDRIQLVYPTRDVLTHLGQTVVVYGELGHAVWGWHFLPIILQVDSIPELRRRPRALSAADRGSITDRNGVEARIPPRAAIAQR